MKELVLKRLAELKKMLETRDFTGQEDLKKSIQNHICEYEWLLRQELKE